METARHFRLAPPRTSRLLVVGAVLTALACGAPASAGTLELRYALTGTASGPNFTGTIQGFLGVRLPAVGPATASAPGLGSPGSITWFSLAALNGQVLNSLASQPLFGFRTASSGDVFLGSVPGSSFLFSVLNLRGVLNGNGPGSITGTRQVSVSVINSSGTSSATTFISGQSYSFSGAEVSRVFTPEPTSGALLGLGALAAMIGGRQIRRHRRP